MLSTTLKKAERAVELTLLEGPRPCAVKRTDEQIVDVPGLQVHHETVEVTADEQIGDVIGE